MSSNAAASFTSPAASPSPLPFLPLPPPSRRILVSELPAGTHLYSILKCIHSGPLVSATILDTSPIVGTKTALIEFVYHENATTFLSSLSDRKLTLTSEATGVTVYLPVALLTTTSGSIPRRVSASIRIGASRLLVALNFPRRCIYPFLVEAGFHRGMGLDTIVEASYAEDGASAAGTGRLTLEFSSVRAALWAQSVLLLRPGLLRSRLPAATTHLFGRDPCRRTAERCRREGPLDLPHNVRDPVGFFTRAEFVTVPLCARLPDPSGPVKSTGGLATTTLHPEDLSPFSSASCPARHAAEEFATQPWTHVDTDTATGTRRVRVPFGWAMTTDDFWKDLVHRNLETRDPAAWGVVDAYFEARGEVNLRKLVALGRATVPCAANMWGILEVQR